MCLLNPNFGEGSRLVQGADADVLIDDTLIEIKTTKKLEFKREYFDQLMGYFILNQVSGIGSLSPKPQINKLAVYFSRFGYLYTFNVYDVVDWRTFPAFVDWFVNRAREEQLHITNAMCGQLANVTVHPDPRVILQPQRQTKTRRRRIVRWIIEAVRRHFQKLRRLWYHH